VDDRGLLVSARIDPARGAIIEPASVQIEGLGLLNNMTAGYAISDDGTLAYLAGAAGATEQFLAWLKPSGAVETMSERGGDFNSDSFVSPDGRMLAVEVNADDDVSIAIHDIERDVRTALIPGAPTAFPVWSPDSRHVIYRLERDPGGIYRAPIDRSTQPEQLLADPEGRYVLPMSWSPDGRFLLYVESDSETRGTNANNDLWVLPTDGSEPRVFLQTEFSEIDPRFSPDGRWVAYSSNQSGPNEVYVRPFEGAGEFQISADGGASPEWNPTGGQLFFQHDGDLYVADIDLSGATPIVSPERPLIEWAPGLRANLWAPAPDGERFLVAQARQAGADVRSLRAILNWSPLREWH
jgi:Tol biopolymer transport system component